LALTNDLQPETLAPGDILQHANLFAERYLSGLISALVAIRCHTRNEEGVFARRTSWLQPIEGVAGSWFSSSLQRLLRAKMIDKSVLDRRFKNLKL